MISKQDIKKLAKRILKQQRGLRDHQIIHPQREWSVIMFASLILMIGGAVWSTVTYNEISQLEVQTDNAGEIKQTAYRADLVLSSLEEFRVRQALYQELLSQSEAVRAREIEQAEKNTENTESDETNDTTLESEEENENEEQPVDSDTQVVSDDTSELDVN